MSVTSSLELDFTHSKLSPGVCRNPEALTYNSPTKNTLALENSKAFASTQRVALIQSFRLSTQSNGTETLA